MMRPESSERPDWESWLVAYDAALAEGRLPSLRLMAPEDLPAAETRAWHAAQRCLRQLERVWPRSPASTSQSSRYTDAASLAEELARRLLETPDAAPPARPIVTVAQLEAAVTSRGILASADLSLAMQGLAPDEPPQTAAALAHDLVQRGVLSANQARVLCDSQLPRLLLGDYLVLEELGHGGMGTVYRAWHARHKVYLALKTLHFTDPQSIARLKHEFRILARRVHPNLVALDELRQEDGRWFFTMELVDGQRFTHYVHGGPPAAGAKPGEKPQLVLRSAEQWSRLRGAMRQLAEGLCALHATEVLHRDIKPSNVLVTAEGRVVLVDFGMALPTDDAMAPRQGLEGTWTYMSPEQMARRPLTESSDWYSVGVMLYVTLFGRLPYEGDFAEVRQAKWSGQPALPRGELAAEHAPWVNLCQELLRADPAARPAGATILKWLSGRFSVPAFRPARREGAADFVGRHALRAALHEAHRQVADGATRCVSIPGGSGLGKTALVRCFFQELSGSALVWSGRCYARESHGYKAFEGIVDALAAHLAVADDADLAALIPAGWRALVRVFPGLTRLTAVPEGGAELSLHCDEQELRRRATVALRELLGGVAQQKPLVLFFDDLQWGDVDSACLLGELMRSPPPARVLCIVAYRSEEAARACVQALARRWAESGVSHQVLTLPPLDASEAEELAQRLLGQSDEPVAADAATVARESAGNPYVLGELVRWLRMKSPDAARGALPVSLDEVLAGQIAVLSPAARQLLDVIAVAGHPLDWDDALAATAPHVAPHLALASLCALDLVRTAALGDGESVEPFHDRVRESVVARLPPHELAACHRWLATVLEARREISPERLWAHFHAAGDRAKGAHYAELAADQAARALAFDHAAELYQAALDSGTIEPQRRRRLLRCRGDALANAGRRVDAAQAYLLACHGAAPEERLELLRLAANQFLRAGRFEEGRDLLRQVLQGVGLPYPRTFLGTVAMFLGGRLRIRWRGLGYTLRRRDLIAPTTMARLEASWIATSSLGMIDAMRGMAYFGCHSLLAFEAGEPVHVGLALIQEAVAHSFSGANRGAEIFAQAEQFAAELDNPYVSGALRQFRGLSASSRGEWRAALTLADQSVTLFRQHGGDVRWEILWADPISLMSLYFLGDLNELRRRILEAVQTSPERDNPSAAALWRSGFGTMAWLAADQLDEARRQAAIVEDAWPGTSFYLPQFFYWLGSLSIDLYAGQGCVAWDRLRTAWPAFRRSFHYRHQAYRILMRHLRARAALMAAAHAADRRGLLAQARREASKILGERQPWADPLGRLVLAAVSAQAGQRARAMGLVQRAIGEFDRSEMALFAAAARCRLSGLEADGGQADATHRMVDCGVRSPLRMLQLLAPGFPDDPRRSPASASE